MNMPKSSKNNIFNVPEHYFEGLEDSIQDKIFATCHCVHNLNGLLVGDTLDVQMINYSKWKYEKSNRPEVKFVMSRDNYSLEVYSKSENTFKSSL